ncbi:MAG: YggS family pyridoxal phosphate-dependent enzyme [Desulfatibacillaceae bacterium]|nr:YggS family pyridoxal phosphate-dependent enzyme [Desulfatibacillaceae bacterium]
MPEISQNIKEVRKRIEKACAGCGRNPADITLIGVTKTVEPDIIREAFSAGIVHFGESFVQEALQKVGALAQIPAQWHFIGHLQTNKAKFVARLFDTLHTLDSEKLALELNRRLQSEGRTLRVLIQVNVSGEKAKSGIAPKQAGMLAQYASTLPNLKLCGLMTIPPFFDAPQKAAPFFAALKSLRDELAAKDVPGHLLSELSMGMTGDFEEAIAQGATMIRVGTAIFGERL